VAERKPFLLRIDPDLYAALARWADDEMRSLNGQIEFLLRRALAGAGRLKSAVTQSAPGGEQRAPSPRSDDRAPEARPSAGWDAMED
jgi:hypothetical protein